MTRAPGRDAPVEPVRLDPVERALEAIAAGRPVVVADHRSREDEGDLIVAADAVTPEQVAFMVRHTSGIVCAPAAGDWLDRLAIPLMTTENTESMRTAFTVTVDARRGVTTGVSPHDRCRTLRVLADPESRPDDLARPGHVFPLRARPGGVLERPGHTEAAVDLTRLAGRAPVGVLAELVHDHGPLRRRPALRSFADRHRLPMIDIDDLVTHRRRHERLVERRSVARLPTAYGAFRAYGYDSPAGEQVALVYGDPTAGGGTEALVRVHSECLTGEAFGSLRCDCGPQLDAAMAAISTAGRGVLVYLRGHEGRGIGLVDKLAAYALQDAGSDTVDANLALGLPADARDYWLAAQILADLGVRRVRLLTNNPAKRDGLVRYGVTVTGTLPLVVPPTAESLRYLAAKRDRLGHQLPSLEEVETA